MNINSWMTEVLTPAGGAGVLASLLCILSYAARSHRSLTFTAAAGVLAWSAHFALKAAWTPCVLSFLMAARVATGAWAIHWGRAQRWQATVLAWGLAVGAAWLTWNGWASVPSTVATLFLTWAGMHLGLAPLRWALLVGEAFWCLNGWVVGSPLAMGCAVVAAGLNIWMIYRAARRPASAGVHIYLHKTP